MAYSEFIPVNGIIQSVEQVYGQCCQQFVSILTSNGIVNFVVSKETYIENNFKLTAGIKITAFYDAIRPVPLIYPPQYQAVAVVQMASQPNITLAYFNADLISADNSLKLNLTPDTEILTSNGQEYYCSIGDRLLLVYYYFTTRSIPAQTTPYKIIVICE